MADENPSLRDVMAYYPTGVTIVTGRDDEGLYGLTVNSFTSVSLEPPLVLVCISRDSSSHDRLVSGLSFAVNVLAADQGTIASRFAQDPSERRFESLAWRPSPSGCPLIAGTVAWLDCSVRDVLDGGDHTILLGRVEGRALAQRPALLFHRGEMVPGR